MVTDLSGARDALSALVLTAWTANAAGAPLLYDNLDGQTPPDPPAVWGRLSIQFDGSTRISIGPPGQNAALSRRTGRLYVQIFTPFGKSGATKVAEDLADAIVAALENAAHADSVRILDPGAQTVGSEDGAWWQVNVRADFQFDRIY